MNPDDALALINQLITNKTGNPLDPLEIAVFKGSWEGESYNQIAINKVYSEGHLKAVGSNLWALLSEVLGKKVSKKSLKLVIEEYCSTSNISPPLPKVNLLLKERREDWGNAPYMDENKFFGRKKELESLKDSIINQKRRLVLIWGMAGIGKTTLAIKLAKDIKDNFDYIIWRSLENAPPFNDFMQDIIGFLSDGQKTNLPEKRDEKINFLREYLRSKRCLVIIDNVDGIPQNDETEEWKEKYQDYQGVLILFNPSEYQLQQGDSHSCLLLTSRGKLPEVEQLKRKNLDVHVLNLEGLETEEGKQIFESFGSFKGSQEQWEKVIIHYAGNPKALELVTPLVENFYQNDLSKLIENLNEFIFKDLRDLLDRQYNQLQLLPLGKEVMYWLAIEREPVQISNLVKDIFLSREGEILNYLKTLLNYSMIESIGSGYYTLHPFVREYFIEKFIEEICDDIQNYKNIENYQDSTLNRYALMKAQSKTYIRESQITFILDPIIKELKHRLGNKEDIENHLKGLILDLQNRFQRRDGYAAGNIIHILIRLEINLRGYDFSNLTIWQAYLSKIDLCQVNFSKSIFNNYNNPNNPQLHNCVFADILHGVFSVAFSKDSNFVAAGDLNGQIHIWDFEKFQEYRTLQDAENIGLFWSIAFHPNENKIATGNDDHTVRLWNIETGESIIIGEHDRSVQSVCFNSDGKILASSSADNTIKLWYWNPQTAQYELHQTLAEHTQAVWSIAFSCDGILASGSDDNTIKLWRKNPNTGKWENYHTFKGHTDHVRSVAFSPDGKLLASGSQDKTVRLWNIETKKFWILEGHEGWVWSVTFNPDGRTLASCGEDQIIKIWNLETKLICSSLIGHDHAVRSIAFNDNGTILFSGSYDQSVKLWEWNPENNQGQCIRTRQGIASAFRSIAFSPDSNFLASGGGDKIVRLWDLKTNDQEQKLKEEHGTWIWSVAFSSDGKTLASCSDDKTLKLWNITDINNPRILQREILNERTRTIAFSPDSNLLAVGSNDARVTLFKRNVSTERWDRREILKKHSNWVWSVAFSPDSKILASCGDDGRINLWNIEPKTVEHFRTLEQDKHQGMVYSLAFSTYNNKIILASGSADNTIKLWNVETGECLKTLKEHSHWVWSVAFSPNGKILASGSADCTVKLWEVETGNCLCNLDILEEPNGHTQWVRTVTISKDGKCLASAGDDQMIKLWDIQDLKKVKFLRNLKPESPYQGMIITDVIGLSDARKEILKILGAIE